MQLELTTEINANNIKGEFSELMALGGTFLRHTDGTRMWTFPVTAISKLGKYLKESVEFTETEVRAAMSLCQMTQAEAIKKPTEVEPGWKVPAPEQIILPGWKGKSGLTITELENSTGKIYEVVEFRKNEKPGAEKIRHVVTEMAVNMIADILNDIDETKFKKGKISNRPIAEKLVQRYGLSQYITGSGDFDKRAWYGERNDYFRYFYYPLKVLAFKGEVEHHKGGGVTKFPKLQERIAMIKSRRESAAMPQVKQKDITSFVEPESGSVKTA